MRALEHDGCFNFLYGVSMSVSTVGEMKQADKRGDGKAEFDWTGWNLLVVDRGRSKYEAEAYQPCLCDSTWEVRFRYKIGTIVSTDAQLNAALLLALVSRKVGTGKY